MRSKLSLIALLVILLSGLTVSAAPPSSDEVMAAAKTEARMQQKAIFLHFGASWCGWCKKLDAYLDREDIKPVFSKYFVSVKLVTQEDPKHKDLENAGADTWVAKLGGPAGLPLSAFLDDTGKIIIDSKRVTSGAKEAQNIGYPSDPAELEWFTKMLKTSAPKITDADLASLLAPLKAPKK